MQKLPVASGVTPMSSVGATLVLVKVRESDVAGIPAGNIRVPEDEFVAAWRMASTRAEEQGGQGATDWYDVAVAVTCRWSAMAPVRPKTGAHRLTRSPATKRARVAYEAGLV